MFGIGIQEFGVILVIALLVFGPKRLPELARMLGRGMGEFRRASHDLRQSLALDDLQNDLRRDLHSAQNALKPDVLTGAGARPDPASERPAQAGDGLEAAAAVADKSAASTSNPTPAAQTDAPTPAPASNAHQGELPLGNDHEHHDDPESEHEAEAQSETRPGAQSRTATEANAESDPDARDRSERTDDETRARGAADSERG